MHLHRLLGAALRFVVIAHIINETSVCILFVEVDDFDAYGDIMNSVFVENVARFRLNAAVCIRIDIAITVLLDHQVTVRDLHIGDVRPDMQVMNAFDSFNFGNLLLQLLTINS